MPWRMVAGLALLGILGGTAFGFVRGLGYLPTLPFALEGAILFGVPAALLGLFLAGVWSLGTAVRRHRA